MIGTTISHFHILDLLGKGGMGEAYLAEDTTLNRQVAIKVLPEHPKEQRILGAAAPCVHVVSKISPRSWVRTSDQEHPPRLRISKRSTPPLPA